MGTGIIKKLLLLSLLSHLNEFSESLILSPQCVFKIQKIFSEITGSFFFLVINLCLFFLNVFLASNLAFACLIVDANI